MGRALIADSHLVENYAAGRKDEICPCVACGQGCVGNADKMIPITCALNPLSGREASMPAVPKAKTPGRVVVVGAGPAGLMAAATAAGRTAARGRAVRLPVDRHRHIMRGHLEGNTSSCAFRVLCLPLQLLFADSLERQPLQGEAVAFADLKTDLSADRVSCGIILARGNPHDSAVQPIEP